MFFDEYCEKMFILLLLLLFILFFSRLVQKILFFSSHCLFFPSRLQSVSTRVRFCGFFFFLFFFAFFAIKAILVLIDNNNCDDDDGDSKNDRPTVHVPLPRDFYTFHFMYLSLSIYTHFLPSLTSSSSVSF